MLLNALNGQERLSVALVDPAFAGLQKLFKPRRKASFSVFFFLHARYCDYMVAIENNYGRGAELVDDLGG